MSPDVMTVTSDVILLNQQFITQNVIVSHSNYIIIT